MLPYPDLAHEFGLLGRQRLVQRVGVDGAVGERGEEDKCSALSWLQLEPEHVEARAAAHGHIVAVDEHSARPRAARLVRHAPRGLSICAVVVHAIELAALVPSHLRNLHVADGLACERLHLGEQRRTRRRLLAQVRRA